MPYGRINRPHLEKQLLKQCMEVHSAVLHIQILASFIMSSVFWGTIVCMFIFGYVTRKLYYRMLKTGDRLQLITYSIMLGYLFQFVCRGSISSWAIDIVFYVWSNLALKDDCSKK